MWQKSWDNQIHKLNHPQDTIGEWPKGYWRNRNEEVILSKLCIIHIHTIHTHVLKWEDTPICWMYKVTLTVKHNLLNCASFSQTRSKYNQTEIMFSKTPNQLTTSVFLKTVFSLKSDDVKHFHLNPTKYNQILL